MDTRGVALTRVRAAFSAEFSRSANPQAEAADTVPAIASAQVAIMVMILMNAI